MMTFEPVRQIRAAGGARPIHLGAIAGGQNHHFGDPGFLAQGAQRGNQSILAKRHLFAQRDRCGLVIDAEDVECHEAFWTVTLLILVEEVPLDQAENPRHQGSHFAIVRPCSRFQSLARASLGLERARLALPAPACAQSPKIARHRQSFYTVTAEIALARHQPRVAALQYAAAAAQGTDIALLERATQVATETLQPSLGRIAGRALDRGRSELLEAQRAAARAALALVPDR